MHNEFKLDSNFFFNFLSIVWINTANVKYNNLKVRCNVLNK